MQRFIAALLLACLGITVPLAAAPLRLCLIEGRVLVPGVDRCAEAAPPDCCKHCQADPEREPCCLELEEMPDAPAPSTPENLPAPPVMDLPVPAFVAPPAIGCAPAVHSPATPVRGPDGPAAQRARLEVWRL